MTIQQTDSRRFSRLVIFLILLAITVMLIFAHAADGQEIVRLVPQPQCVQVLSLDTDGRSNGTGALIAPRIVVTARHVVKDRKGDFVEILFPNWQVISGEVIHAVKSPDLAFIRLDATPTCEPLRLTSRLTSPLSVQGYGHGPWRQSWGPLSDTLYGPYRMVSGTDTRSGDSGGPVIDDRGRFAGTLWGAVDGETYFTPLEEILKHVPEDVVFPTHVLPDPTPLYGG